jgi:hypothetical protein
VESEARAALRPPSASGVGIITGQPGPVCVRGSMQLTQRHANHLRGALVGGEPRPTRPGAGAARTHAAGSWGARGAAYATPPGQHRFCRRGGRAVGVLGDAPAGREGSRHVSFAVFVAAERCLAGP